MHFFKTCIVVNDVLFSGVTLIGPHRDRLALDPKEVKILPLNKEYLEFFGVHKEKYRFVVSIGPSGFTDFVPSIGFRFTTYNGFDVVGGFRECAEDREFAHLAAIIGHGPQNGVMTIEGKDGCDGIYQLVGPGAGPSPTVATMMQDAKRLLGIQ